jgi:hypothetical protein
MREELSRELDLCQVEQAELYDELFKIEKAITNSHNYAPKEHIEFFGSTTRSLIKQKEMVLKRINILKDAINTLEENIKIGG